MTTSIRTSMTLVLFVLAGSIPACAADLGPEDANVGAEEAELVATRGVAVDDDAATVDWCDASSPTYVSGVHQCTYDLRSYAIVTSSRKSGYYAVAPGQPFQVTCECHWGNTSGDPSCAPGQMEATPMPTCPATDTTWTTFLTYSSNSTQCALACATAAPAYDLDYGCCS
ncbi:MAG: hypothetical protein IT379_22280 [Deltaproteobacteria bacterium]|nr:hypothetical protein [Deltaproteobacteria bacterium]